MAVPQAAAPSRSGDLVERTRRQARAERLFRPGDVVVVGVSGRADSVALLHVLHRLSAGEHLQLVVAHHQTDEHPERATDAAFVRDLAHELKLPLELMVDKSPPSDQQERAMARRTFLGDVRSRVGASVIATGETADDTAEYLLDALLASAPSPGHVLTQALPCLVGANGHVCPLLSLTHEDCQFFLVTHNLSFRHDPEALDLSMRRRRWRLLILPMIRRHVAAEGTTTEPLALSARILADDEHFLSELAAIASQEVRLEDTAAGVALAHATWSTLPSPLRRRVLANAVARATPNGKNRPQPSRDLLHRLDAACRKLRTGASISEGDLKAVLQRGTLVLSVQHPTTTV